MPNLTRNDITIEGANVNKVLDYIGFNPDGVPIVWGAKQQPGNIAVLIDFDRIVPRPKEPPDEGWEAWFSENWGTVPYDGAQPGDIFELTSNRASFKFYTKWTSPFPVIETLAKHFLDFRFNLKSWDQTNHRASEAEWENGHRTLYVPLFGMKLNRDLDGNVHDEPANDPVSDEMRATASQLVKAAMDAYNGRISQKVNAESTVAEVIAASGNHVKVEIQPNTDGSCCLCVYVQRLK